jgi:NAD(P)-dependent dehydrogenase (short-subunit alcohol dehydrogenase family)
MAETRVAFVTGGNRGLGLEIVRQLGRLGILAVIGARQVAKGLEAAEKLQSEGLEVPVVGIDLDDEQSAAQAVAEVQRLYGRCDVLVNNAAILIDGQEGFQASILDVKSATVRQTFETNVLGPMRLIQAVGPLMKAQNYGRIVNISSGAGQLSDMGMGYPAYRLSKTALNALTRITAVELAGHGVKVNACNPGWVKTEMGGPDATRSVEEGADTPVWLATLPDDGPNGGFFRDRKPIAW